MLASAFLDSFLDGNSLQNRTISFEFVHSPQSEENCDIFDPVVGDWSLAKCNSARGAVCQFKKGNNNNKQCLLICMHSILDVM